MGSARLVDIADCLALSPSSLLRSASFECTTARHTSDGIHSSLVLVGFNPRGRGKYNRHTHSLFHSE